MKNLKNYFISGMIGAGSLVLGNEGYGQTEIDSKHIEDSLEHWQVNVWMRELYKKDSVKFKEKCYDLLNKKIGETRGEIAYYKSIEKPDLADVEHLKDNEKLYRTLKAYSCDLFEPKKKEAKN